MFYVCTSRVNFVEYNSTSKCIRPNKYIHMFILHRIPFEARHTVSVSDSLGCGSPNSHNVQHISLILDIFFAVFIAISLLKDLHTSIISQDLKHNKLG